MPNTPATIFNPGSVSLQIVVNNGNPISLAGTGPAQNWVPTNSTSSSFTGGYPAPNAFGYGGNYVQVNAGGESSNVQVSIPMSKCFSLQLYIFLRQLVGVVDTAE